MKGWYVNDELQRMCKEAFVAYFLKYYPGIRLEGRGKLRKTCHYNISPSRYLNSGSLEYEAGVLITLPRRSVPPFPSTFFKIHYSLIILSFEAL
jgi:hypothetical protein